MTSKERLSSGRTVPKAVIWLDLYLVWQAHKAKPLGKAGAVAQRDRGHSALMDSAGTKAQGWEAELHIRNCDLTHHRETDWQGLQQHTPVTSLQEAWHTLVPDWQWTP